METRFRYFTALATSSVTIRALSTEKIQSTAMFNPFKPVELIKTEVFMSMPAKFRKKGRTAWSDPNRQGAEVECFLEGPSFDREGNLWFVDKIGRAHV